MSIKTIIIILGLIFFFPFVSQAAGEQCLTVTTENNFNCESLNGNYKLAADQTTCGYLPTDSICCCPAQKLTISPKYIIIGVLALVLGGAAVTIAIFRKNEVQ